MRPRCAKDDSLLMRYVGVIPARGGSKSIPQKNLANCGGASLLAHTARSALECGRLQEVILSTDDEDIADAGRALGLSVPFLRPHELASDESPMIGVLQHVLKWLDDTGRSADALVLLQPTSPLRKARHIRESIELYESSGAASVVSVVRVPHQFGPSSILFLDDGQLLPYEGNQHGTFRRQDKPSYYARNGPAILVVRRSVVDAGKLYGEPTVGYEMGALESIDVDGPDDLFLASLILRHEKPGGE